MSTVSATMPRVFAFPKSGIAYNECLYAAVAREGVTVEEGVWAGRWLLANIAPGDIVHIHWPSFLYYNARSTWKKLHGLARFFLLYFIIRRRGGRIVWTAHNLYPHDGGRAEWSHRLVRRFITRNADVIVAHSPSAKKILQAEFHIADNKLVEVPHGNWIGYHPRTTTRAAARAALNISPDAQVYAMVGACRPYKNLEALIDAFRRLDGNCFLLIAGQFQSKEYKARIEELIAQLPADKVRMDARFIENNEVQTYVAASDVFVVPYTEILTSGSAMLGLSFGVPVIVPNIGSMSDLIAPRCGLLYDVNEPDGLLRAMREIRSRQFSAAEITEYAHTFDWKRSAQMLIASFRQLGAQEAIQATSARV